MGIHAPPTRHIGGSLLPSSSPLILQPIEIPFGRLQVKALPDLDEHALFVEHDRGTSILAMHPNGFSCHALAERIAAGDKARVRQQVEYILRCGGLARSFDTFDNIIDN